jgi:hypothetical protein
MLSSLILPFPLESILSDINRAIDAKLYYPAVLVSLTIPEICSALALPNTTFVKERHYVAFVDQYTTEPELGLSGQSCYRLRGGVVHRASFARHPLFDATHVIFSLPGSKFSVHAMSIVSGSKRAAAFDLLAFCKAMDSAARKWYADNYNNPLVEENMKHLIRFCPFGLSPFLGGVPVVGSGE